MPVRIALSVQTLGVYIIHSNARVLRNGISGK